MPDFLTHVLLMYVVLEIASWRVDWLTRPRIVVGMAGAIVPDLVKIWLLLPSYQVEAVLGIPFSWTPLHRLGGAVLSAGLLSLLVDERERRGVLALLVAGLLFNLFLDALLARPGPETYDILAPFTHYRFPILDADLYLSSDFWPSVSSTVLAVLVYVASQIVD